jgi:flavin-dependent dehydrogenase
VCDGCEGIVQHPGVVRLNRWGLLPSVAASNCPPVRTFTTDFGDFPLRVPIEQGDGVDADYAPRRVVLDKILVDAAVAAGAELRERFTVHELVWDNDRVVGIRGRSSGGAMVREDASIVIGADGLHSVGRKGRGGTALQRASSVDVRLLLLLQRRADGRHRGLDPTLAGLHQLPDE